MDISKIPKSTQYCSFRRKKHNKKDDWIALHPDHLHSSLESLLYFTKNKFELFSNTSNNVSDESTFKHWEFLPILVVNAELLLCKIVDNNIEIEEVPRVSYLASHIKECETISNKIEVVTENYFPNLLDEYYNLDKSIINVAYSA